MTWRPSSIRNWIVSGLLVVVALALSTCALRASAQTVTTSVQGGAEVWPHADRAYQNRLSAAGTVTARMGALRIEAWMRAIAWGASDAKRLGSVLSAEALRVIERRHGLAFYVQKKGLQLGPAIHRRAVHHIWRHKAQEGRHDHFPGSWQIGRRGCNGKATPSHPAGEACPSIGYWDGVRTMVGYEGHGFDVRVLGPLWTWKESLTLPWPSLIWKTSYESGPWTLRADGRAFGHVEWALDVEVRRELIGPVELGIAAGQVASPIWTEDNLQRITTTIIID